ncbi:acyltransferase [Paraburkholderia caffeinilytica]|uniref:acyltransferase n=1 Tax=Paraburkholderia caffeinilytica TaxID=1761016 RepID=UPI0038BD7EB9
MRWLMRRPKGLRRLGDSTRIAFPLQWTSGHCIEIGDRVVMGRNCLLQPIERYLDQVFQPRLLIEDDCYVGHDCQFHSVNYIRLGAGSVLSDQVYVSDVNHGLDPRAGLIMDQSVRSKGPVDIGNGSFVGFGAVLLSGVTLGKHCVVGARSVVTHSVPDYTMVAGSPAREIATFNFETGTWSATSNSRESGQ